MFVCTIRMLSVKLIYVQKTKLVPITFHEMSSCVDLIRNK